MYWWYYCCINWIIQDVLVILYDKILLLQFYSSSSLFFSFCFKCLKCRWLKPLWQQGWSSEPCDMHKYGTCASYLAHLLHPWNYLCASNVSMKHKFELIFIIIFLLLFKMPMIKTVVTPYDSRIGWVSFVICTSTKLVHPTWVTGSIPEIVCVCPM